MFLNTHTKKNHILYFHKTTIDFLAFFNFLWVRKQKLYFLIVILRLPNTNNKVKNLHVISFSRKIFQTKKNKENFQITTKK